MKQISHIIIALTVLASTRLSANNVLAQKAEQLYAQKNYREAISCYQSIIKEGFSSYKLYYNLGNAYYKNNELGNAIYYYELAHKLQPNQKDVLNNLIIANAKTIDNIESKENFFLHTIKSGLVNSFSTTTWAWLSIACLVVALAAAFLFFITNRLTLKRIGFLLACVSLLLFISTMAFGFIAVHDKEKTTFAIIIQHESTIYDEPSTASNSKFTLHEGTKVAVLETTANWTNIKLENGNEGWVKTSEVGLF